MNINGNRINNKLPHCKENIATDHFIIANWKMNFTLKNALSYLEKLSELENGFLASKNSGCLKKILAVPNLYLAYLSEKFPECQFAAQDVSAFDNFGPYTGEISAEMLYSSGIFQALVGHSERRINFNETNLVINKKAQNCIKAGISPIICLGESLEIRNNGNYKEFILKQAKESVPSQEFIQRAKFDEIDNNRIILAYEPIWSIGTGLVPNFDQIYEIAELLRNEFCSGVLEKKMSVVYGGSVNKNNLKDILDVSGLSGVLIGSASLEPDIFFLH